MIAAVQAPGRIDHLRIFPRPIRDPVARAFDRLKGSIESSGPQSIVTVVIDFLAILELDDESTRSHKAVRALYGRAWDKLSVSLMSGEGKKSGYRYIPSSDPAEPIGVIVLPDGTRCTR